MKVKSILVKSLFLLMIIIFVLSSLTSCMMAPDALDGGDWDGGDWDGGDEDDYSGNETYEDYGINPEISTDDENQSTFAVDVDTGSYTNARRFIMQMGELPPPESVRAEEFLNYFDYDYELPENDDFNVTMEVSPSLYRENKHTLRIGVQGKGLTEEEHRQANIVFLIDTSGSMSDDNKLPLVKQSLLYLLEQLNPDDYVSIATYYGTAQVYMQPTQVGNYNAIQDSINSLTANGSTNAEGGIQVAYDLLNENFIEGGINTIMMFSDGDANVGNVTPDTILDTVEEYLDMEMNLSTFGYGMGNYNDTLMEQLANKGHGYYFYIDTIEEAQHIFNEELISLLHVLARDVKVQVEFDVDTVEKFRLVGYENRMLDNDDFDDEEVEGGVIGSYHQCTAIYELTLYEEAKTVLDNVVTFRMNYKQEFGNEVLYIDELVLTTDDIKTDTVSETSPFYRLACDVAEFAQILRENPYVVGGEDGFEYIVPSTIDDVITNTTSTLNEITEPEDEFTEFLDIIETASGL